MPHKYAKGSSYGPFSKGSWILLERSHQYGGDQVARVVAVRGKALRITKFLTRGMRWAKPIWIIESEVAGVPDEDDHRLALAKALLEEK